MRVIQIFTLSTFLSNFIFSQQLTPSQLTSLDKNVHWINSESLSSIDGWQVIDDFIENKSIILLGEFNHETPEVFEIKNGLIKYLHERHGFNTILFEAGIGELIIPNNQKESMTPNQMTYGFFSYWRTKEVQDLMAYVQKEEMEIAGFDVQRFGRSFSNHLIDEVSKLNMDTLLYQSIEKQFGKIQGKLTKRNAKYDSLKDQTNSLIDRYIILLDALESNDEANMLLIKRTLKNRIHYLTFRLQFLKDKDWSQRWMERDSMMAENVTWLLDNFYKNERVIIYAHNFHIAKHNKKEEVMGAYLASTMNDEMYSMGFYAGSGTFGKDKTLSPPDSLQLDIKHIISALKKGVNFLNLSDLDGKAKWLNQPIIVNDTFIDLSSSNTMILPKHFDGLILIDQIGDKD